MNGAMISCQSHGGSSKPQWNMNTPPNLDLKKSKKTVESAHGIACNNAEYTAESAEHCRND